MTMLRHINIVSSGDSSDDIFRDYSTKQIQSKKFIYIYLLIIFEQLSF